MEKGSVRFMKAAQAGSNQESQILIVYYDESLLQICITTWIPIVCEMSTREG